MPRGATSKRARANRDSDVTNPVDTGETTTVTATDTVREDLPFEIKITPAEEGFRPDRSNAGRKRLPSPFEDPTKPYYLPNLKGAGWQNWEHDGNVVPENQEEIDAATESGGVVPAAKYNVTSSVRDSNAKAFLRELEKAVKYLNLPHNGDHNLGLDKNVTAELVQFNIRDKQDRKPRTAPGGGDVSSDDDEASSDDSGDE